MPGPHLSGHGLQGPHGAVLFLHGGRERDSAAVRPTDLPVLRMEWLRRAVEPRLRAEGFSVYFLRFAVRGWNGDGASAIADACWALDEIARRASESGNDSHGIVLVGHSMGGRTAVHAARHRRVESVVALAPWLPDGESVDGVIGRRLAVAHGTSDHTTSPKASRRFVARAVDAGAAATWTSVGRDGHALLRRRRVWDDFVVAEATR